MFSISCPEMMYPSDPPPTRWRGRARGQQSRRPNLREIEQLVYVLVADANVWRVVDAFDPALYSPHYTSSIHMALWRRGFDVVVRTVDGDRVVWARWPHPAPDEWVVVSPRDPERELGMTASTTDPQWHQLSIDDL